MAEIGADGRRSQIFMALSTAAEFRDHLTAFSDFYAGLGPVSGSGEGEEGAGSGQLKSEMMVKDNRRYFVDLKENQRGRFLRVSQTVTRGGPRSQIAIPAQGMIEVRNALTDLVNEFGGDDDGEDEGPWHGPLPEGRHLRVDNKNFYFDVGQNNRGIYMRISEVLIFFLYSLLCLIGSSPILIMYIVFFCKDPAEFLTPFLMIYSVLCLIGSSLDVPFDFRSKPIFVRPSQSRKNHGPKSGTSWTIMWVK